MKKIKILLFTVFSLLLSTNMVAQEKSISGTVTSKSDGSAIPGVSVVVQNTTRGTETDFDGKYSIQASVGDVLTFSFVGMKSSSVTITANSSTINVALEDGDNILDEVVVTALGIKKTRKSLTYSAQDIKADELNKVKQTNPMNSLSGKIAGASITRSASGAGGSVKVLIRGNSSIGNNQPLYVVDGIPLSNPSSGQPGDTFGDINGGNRDGGDALSLINPDDIESLTVLKGASASALYGSAGLNGVILITTKKGKSGSFKVDVSSGVTVENPAYMMDFSGAAQKNVDAFLQSGSTYINSFSISGGTETAQTYFSYSNTIADGIIPTNNMRQHTFNVKETAQLLDDKLKLTASVMGSTQNFTNRAISGLYFNPLVGVYGFDPSAGSLSDYKNFEQLDVSRNIMSQRWFRGTSDIEQNPFWITNRNKSTDSNTKLVASLNLGYTVNDWLSIQARGTYDKTTTEFERKIYATTEATLAPANGRYIVNQSDFTQMYGDLIATINTKLNDDIDVNVIAGASTTRSTTESLVADSGTNGGLQFANVFAYQNFNANASVNFRQNSYEIRGSSVFASATFGFKDKLFVDVTARNDWTSTLPDANNSFFYPSIGVTGIISEMFEMNENISFAKVRMSYAEVGNGFAADQITPNRSINFGGGVSNTSPVIPFPGTSPKPERQRSFEFGTEWKFYNNRLGIDIGYYNTSTINQYFRVPISDALYGIPVAGLNSGDIVNSGIEATVYAIPVQKDNFKWTTSVNFASNKNEIKKLADFTLEGVNSLSHFVVSGKGVNTFGSYLVKGGSFGDIYGHVIKKDANGTPIYDNGAFVIDDTNQVDGLTKVGNSNPKFTLGWNNSLEFKNFTVDFLIDGKFGGETMSMTEAIVEGFSNNSARENGGGTVDVVDLAGTASTLTTQEYYGKAGGRNGFTGEYVYSATNVRLAELAIGYNFNLSDDSFFKRVKASLVGNNLFFFYKDAPHDPNVSLSTGNTLQGVDVLGLPSTRSIGLNLNLTF
jgi:TonB-dependent SusC/RagA subfamily outer membrane receptor